MNTVPVFYTPDMVADSRSVSPSAAKPAKVVASWLQHGFPIEVREPSVATIEQLQRVHDPDYVADILECRRDNGFGNRSPEVAASLLYTNGAMLSAAQHALSTKTVACAPVSGFHHAGFWDGDGFCTFNGLMMTAMQLLADGTKKVGILDFDMHYGNGTDQIIDVLQVRDKVRHYTAGAVFTAPEHAPFFFGQLGSILASFQDCDVVLYQAGADPHINDPYGGWLTTTELGVRDHHVFRFFHDHGIPVAWNLAGGYQIEPDGSIPKVLEIHDNTMRECASVYFGGAERFTP